MNVLLIHLNPLGATFQIGLACITSVLEEKRHNVSFLTLSRLDKKIILKEILRNKNEIILISLTSDSFDLCKKIIKFINKKTNAPILLGGIHPTLCPEDVIKLEGILGLCIGEGEYPVCELVEAIEDNRNYTDIKNLWIKEERIIYKNDLRSLIQNLDILPLPNYEIFTKQIDFKILPVILTRGCPFNCSYCCNHTLRKAYAGKGKLLRHYSASYSMKLINHLLKQFSSIKEIEFYDDTFTIHREWLRSFLKQFSQLGIRFACNARFNIIDEDLIRLLANSGCVKINIAIECGNEKIRKEILERSITDNEILEKSKLIKKYKIHLHTHNMIGIPYEEEKDILKTIELNKIIDADSVQVSIFNPYPKTKLKELCDNKTWINNKLKTTSYRDFTVLKTPFIKPHIVNYYFLIFTAMVFESGLCFHIEKMFFWIIHIHNNSLYIIFRNFKIKILSLIGMKEKGFIKRILYFSTFLQKKRLKIHTLKKNKLMLMGWRWFKKNILAHSDKFIYAIIFQRNVYKIICSPFSGKLKQKYLLMNKDRNQKLFYTKKIKLSDRKGNCDGNFVMCLDISDEADIGYIDRYGPELISLMKKVLVKDDIFVDIGAHVGYFSLAGAILGAQVISFEPEEINYRKLCFNIAINNLSRQINTFNMALSNRTGKIQLTVNPINRGGHNVNVSPENLFYTYYKEKGYDVERDKKQMVEVDSLDNIIQNMDVIKKQIKLIKIDVEGHEEYVLKGMVNLLTNNPPFCLYIEDKFIEWRVYEKFLSQYQYRILFFKGEEVTDKEKERTNDTDVLFVLRVEPEKQG